MNSKKIILRNFFVSFISQIIIIVFGLIVPRIVLINYGSDTNGLLNTITQIFTYMALLESGTSQAATNALYKPSKNNDYDSISFYASLAKKQYRKIALIYASIVVALAVSLPFLLKTSSDYWTVFFVVLFEGLTNVITFYFINTWLCVLNSSGKSYVNNTINLLTRILCFGIKITLCLLQINIVLIQVGYFFVSLLKLLFYYLYMKKRYSWLSLNVDVGKEKLPQKNHFFVTEIASVIFQSTDMIILSIFVSTSLSSVYSIYNLICVSLSSFLNGIYISLVYLLNQAYISNIEKYKKLHNVFNSFFIGVMAALMCVTYLLITPFVEMYTSGISDISYINKWYPLLFCLIPLLSWCRYTQTNLAGISGNAKKMAICSVIESSVNLVLSIILVNFFGIIGVLIATLVALPIKVVYLNYLSEKVVMKRKATKTIEIIVANLLIFGVTVLFSFLLPPIVIANVGDFIKNGIVLTLLFLIISLSINSFINSDLFTSIQKIINVRKN